MALEQKLSLKLSQRLVMTPSLQQAIKLLQMTRLELDGVLTQEIEENPLLEDGEITTEEESPEEVEPEKKEDASDEIDFEAYFGEFQDTWETTGVSSLNEEREGPPLENRLSREPDLYDHLLWQLRMMDLPPLRREIAELVVGNLDPDGFLAATLEEIRRMGADSEHAVPLAVVLIAESPGEEAADDASAALGGNGSLGSVGAPTTADIAAIDATEAGDAVAVEESAPLLGYPMDEVVAAVALVRSLDPPGVACYTLQESLLCQLDAQGEPADSLARRLIQDFWEPFTHRRFEPIARSLGIPLAELEPAVERIRSLETRPGNEYRSEPTHYVEPDVHVLKISDKYVIQLNDDGLPRLRVSNAYRKMLKAMRREGRQAEAQAFIKEKMRSAVWLIKSLDQRQRTIYKVASSIVEQQRAFLDHGIEHLRPMVLRDVAEDIGMHESTVSRVVSNKYIHTPRGLFPMKFFFHSAIDREYGGDISSLTVKRKLQNLIGEEDPKRPLSDSDLMRIFNREGINIARRTVAKYRDELGIPSSTERRKIF